jgi:hypothetical protein
MKIGILDQALNAVMQALAVSDAQKSGTTSLLFVGSKASYYGGSWRNFMISGHYAAICEME